jgi:ribonuclease P protein component
MRRSEDFRRTVRRGVRAGRRTVVVHALRLDTEPAEQDVSHLDGPGRQVGFVVSKAVGPAVRRNRVRRRLRHLALARLDELPVRTLVVVRALPPAGAAGPELGTDLDAAWDTALARLARR